MLNIWKKNEKKLLFVEIFPIVFHIVINKIIQNFSNPFNGDKSTLNISAWLNKRFTCNKLNSCYCSKNGHIIKAVFRDLWRNEMCKTNKIKENEICSDVHVAGQQAWFLSNSMFHSFDKSQRTKPNNRKCIVQGPSTAATNKMDATCNSKRKWHSTLLQTKG